MMMLLAVLLLIDASRCEACYNADVIELNHVYDPVDGCHRFTQVIVWNWKPEVCEHHVDYWCIVDTGRLSQLPTRTSNGWRVRCQDGVVVSAKVYRETRTTTDPELADKRNWHESRRWQWRKPR